MTNHPDRRCAFLLLVCIFSAACTKAEPDLPANPVGQGEAPRPQLSRPVPDFTFEKQDGTSFGLSDLKGKVWIADFVFTQCQGPCPVMTSGMKALQQSLADVPDLALVTFTVDPLNDTVPVLAEYAKASGADPKRWHFLRGTLKDTIKVSAEGFQLGHPENPLEHSKRFALVDRAGIIRATYLSDDDEHMRRLPLDVRRLAKDGSL